MTEYIYCFNCERPTTPSVRTFKEKGEAWGAPFTHTYDETVCSECGKDDIENTVPTLEAWTDIVLQRGYVIRNIDGRKVALNLDGKEMGRWWPDYECGWYE